MKRWKMHYPMLRCPGCKCDCGRSRWKWLFIDAHGQFRLRFASKKQIEEVRGPEAVE